MNIDKSLKFDNFFTKNDKNLRDISFIVLHHTQASSVNEAIKMYIDCEVSVHYIISSYGKIYQLVDDCDVAYHAGVSYWAGIDGLNKTSIGIELIAKDPYKKGYSKKQMNACLRLCGLLKNKYNILAQNVVAHSDIGYFKESGYLNRKSDVSEKFDWSDLYKNNIAANIDNIEQITKLIFDKNHNYLFRIGEKSDDVLSFKKFLKNFGYKVDFLNNSFDEECIGLAEVFRRRFLR